MHEQKVRKAYNTEMVGALAIYALMLVLSIRFGRPMDGGVLRTIVLASPMTGFFLAVWAVARQLRRVDEFQRQMILENLAFAAAVTACASFTYGFLETVSYQKLSMFWVWMVMGGAWAVITFARCRLGRG
ncbi:hypothetical protein LP419_00105 [Massilia sp. H-1]|nr:hypothetical protein LP419_00105 [Massilia sp. H-1]